MIGDYFDRISYIQGEASPYGPSPLMNKEKKKHLAVGLAIRTIDDGRVFDGQHSENIESPS